MQSLQYAKQVPKIVWLKSFQTMFALLSFKLESLVYWQNIGCELDQNAFGFLLQKDAKSTGELMIGGYNPKYVNDPKWASLSSENYWTVGMSSLKFGGKSATTVTRTPQYNLISISWVPYRYRIPPFCDFSGKTRGDICRDIVEKSQGYLPPCKKFEFWFPPDFQHKGTLIFL